MIFADVPTTMSAYTYYFNVLYYRVQDVAEIDEVRMLFDGPM